VSAGSEITAAVRSWLDGLEERQRSAATLPFETQERFVWAYTPGTREGLAIRDMDRAQRGLANQILAAALSSRTAAEVGAIMALESVLGELERTEGRGGWLRRDPELYWFAVFGEPGDRAPWSWRLGGHHVAVHVTIAGNEVIGTAPSFLGANPAVTPSGPRAGQRTLPGEEALARALLSRLTEAERRAAWVDDVAPADIVTGTGRLADVRTLPVGVRQANLGPAARAALEALLLHYVSRVRPEVAEQRWRDIAADGLGDVTFAWEGSDTPGRGHYYAIRGPRFAIEYDNTQNGANHIHSVWRDLGNDWGEDLLAAHMATAHP